MKSAMAFSKTEVAYFELCRKLFQERRMLITSLGHFIKKVPSAKIALDFYLFGKNLTISVCAEKLPKKIMYDIAFVLSI